MKTEIMCKLHIDVPSCFSGVPPRCILINWGYAKVVIGCVLLLFSGYQAGGSLSAFLMYNQRFAELEIGLIFSVLTILTIVDIVYNSTLIAAVYRQNVPQLKKYYNYSHAMWLVTPVTGVLFAIGSFNELLMYVTRDYGLNRMVITQLSIMFASLILQSYIMVLIKRMIATIDDVELIGNANDRITSNKKQIYDSEFTVKIDDSATEKEIDNEDSAEPIETTCEKAKLTE